MTTGIGLVIAVDFEVLLYLCRRLCDAKKGLLLQQGVRNPSDSAMRKSITSDELSRHCRRRTRGTQETTKAIEDLLLQFTPATDAFGVPVFRYTCISHIYPVLLYSVFQ